MQAMAASRTSWWSTVWRSTAAGAILGPLFAWSIVGIGRWFHGRPPVTFFKAWLHLSVIVAPFSVTALFSNTYPHNGHESNFTVAQSVMNGIVYGVGGLVAHLCSRNRVLRWFPRVFFVLWVAWFGYLIWVRQMWRPAP